MSIFWIRHHFLDGTVKTLFDIEGMVIDVYATTPAPYI
jgi:hypothetical protein